MRMPRKSWILAMVALAALAFASCGGDGRSAFTAEILSEQPSDGDISSDPVNGFFISNGPNTLFFGFDDSIVNGPEFRAFLTFPLGQVPATAFIESATLTVNVVSAQFAATIPTLVDLVSYVPGALIAADFNSAPLQLPGGGNATIGFDMFSTDVGFDVPIDVTLLMREAQRRALPDMQVRLLLAFVANPVGFIGIDDRPTVSITAPLLTVRFF